MIQRKQTLFLLFSMIMMAGYLFSPVVRMEGNGVATNITAWEMTHNIGFPVIGHYFVFVIAIAAGITIALNGITILLYNKRKLQAALCWLAILPALFCFLYVYYNWATKENVYDTIFYYGNISPCVAIVFMLLAAFSIRADENLLRESSRLR
ncbi:MAG: DUF4293 domain-containing protein [Chitinophagales bacterium]